MKRKLNCVLLVDDNESDNFLHKRLIEQAGITNQVEVALNGEEALELLRKRNPGGNSETSCSQPDLILLDINMPVMDGWEFLEEYLKLEDNQKGKVILIMLTTSINPADLLKARKYLGDGCFHYKPLTMDMIREIMEHYFPEYLD